MSQAVIDTDRPVRIGVIGCGALGAHHARRFDKMEGVELAALSDPNADALGQCVESLEAPPATASADYREILHSGLDAVCIATPDSLHVPQLLDALEAGLHVLCEKPLTLDPRELVAVQQAQQRAGKHVAMTYPRRYDGSLRAMRREVQSGRWGAIKTVTAYNSEDWITPNVGTWRHDPTLCPGGFFHDASGHQLDTLFWITALQPESVQCSTDGRGCPVPITIWGTARLQGGVPLTFTFVGDGHQWRELVNIHCEGRDFVLQNGRGLWTEGRELNPISPPEPGERPEEAFIRLLHGEGPNWAPVEDIWPLLLFTRTALESAEKGVAVAIPPVNAFNG